MTEVINVLAARAAARAQHQGAAAALERAQHAQSVAAGEVERLAAEERSWLDRHARKLREWISGGSTGPRPEPKADATVLVKQASARAQLAAADAALESFARAELEARQELAATETALDQAMRAVLTAEGDREAEEILREEAALEARRIKLRGLRELVPPTVLVRRAAPMSGDWLHIPVAELRAHGDGGPRDTLHTPLHKIGTAEVDPAAAEYWQSRRASLLSGEGIPPFASLEDVA